MSNSVVLRKQLDIKNIVGVGSVHLLACLAPFFVDWPAFFLFLFLFWLSGWIGVTLCFHRLLTHTSFETYRWCKYIFTVCGTLAWEGGPLTWVGYHRGHHQFSDQPGKDPHSPLDGFWWSHILWVFFKSPLENELHKYNPDLRNDPGMVLIHRWFWVPQATLFVLLAVCGYFYNGIYSAVAWVVWGIGLRTVVTYHVTWCINSICHSPKWGSRNHDTKDNSRNIPGLLAFISGGESGHNNHHYRPRCAAHGRGWRQIDPTYWTIKFLAFIGLAWNIVEPKSETT